MKLATTALLLALTAATAAPDAAPSASNGDYRLVRIRPHAARNRRLTEREAPSASTNWAGYVAATDMASPAPGSVTDVSGTWTVPEVSPSASAKTYSASWVGIDGYSDGTVEQIGAEADWTPRGARFYAWFEMFPHAAYLVSGFDALPGQEIRASVHFDGGSLFTLTLENLTNGQTFSTTQRARGARQSSAEWIVEAPATTHVLKLADFGRTRMTRCTATIDGRSGGIGDPAWQSDSITMQAKRVVKASTSPLDGTGAGFEVTWDHE